LYVFVFGLALFLVFLFYSAPPLRLKTIPPLDLIANALGFGILPFFIGWTIIETEINYLLAVYGIIVGLPVISYYLFISSFDIEKDKEANVETSCTKLGFNNTIRVGIALYFIGFVLSIIFLGLFSILTISFIVCSPLISALVIKNKNIFKMLITASYFFWTGTILIMLFIFSFSLIPIMVFLPILFMMIFVVNYYYKAHGKF